PGDRLVSVDGIPFTSAGAFRGLAGKVTYVAFQRDGGREQIAALVPVRQTAVDAFAAATGASARVIEHKGHRIGYVHLWCCTHRQVLQQLEHAVRVKLADTDGLVLDLRDGYGGSPGWFDYVFFQPELTIRVRTRDGHTALERYGYGNRPLAAIINSGSRSAKEYLAYELKKTGRATLVGSTTAGYFLGAGAEAIGDDGLLMFPASDLLLDGQRLEGVGVAPHIAVDPVATYSPDDSQVRAAVDEVAKRLRT
ncbi:MAG: S41 family peptidase, partial [Pirellulaceae bacterium]